jgi:Tfp pilus assembly protein PilE
MAMISILAIIAIPTYFSFLKKAKRVEAESALNTIYKLEMIYSSDNGGDYTDDLDALDFKEKLKYYTISITIDNSNPSAGFKATAKGNIDRDSDLDILSIDETGKLVHESKD